MHWIKRNEKYFLLFLPRRSCRIFWIKFPLISSHLEKPTTPLDKSKKCVWPTALKVLYLRLQYCHIMVISLSSWTLPRPTMMRITQWPFFDIRDTGAPSVKPTTLCCASAILFTKHHANLRFHISMSITCGTVENHCAHIQNRSICRNIRRRNG